VLHDARAELRTLARVGLERHEAGAFDARHDRARSNSVSDAQQR
jgi:hypothetical protein